MPLLSVLFWRVVVVSIFNTLFIIRFLGIISQVIPFFVFHIKAPPSPEFFIHNSLCCCIKRARSRSLLFVEKF